MLNLKKNLRLVIAQKKETAPLPFIGKRAENCSHNLGKALGKGLAHKFSYKRMDVNTEFFVRCRRTYILNKTTFEILGDLGLTGLGK